MPSKQVTTLTSESIEHHRNWCLGRGQSLNTGKAYSTDLKEFLKAVGDPVTMEDFEELGQAWLNMTRFEVAPRTTGRRLTSLRSFARYAGQPYLLSEYVAPKPGKSMPHPIPEGIEGVKRMIEVARNADQRALVGLMGLMGLRVSEALSIGVEHFDLNDMMLVVRGKGDRTRHVPISSTAWEVLSNPIVAAMERDDKKLVHYQDRSARKCITNLGRRAGLSRSISSHDLRATFATEAYNHTKDQRVVQELMGHANGSTTEIYIGVSVAKMKAAVEF